MTGAARQAKSRKLALFPVRLKPSKTFLLQTNYVWQSFLGIWISFRKIWVSFRPGLESLPDELDSLLAGRPGLRVASP